MFPIETRRAKEVRANVAPVAQSTFRTNSYNQGWLKNKCSGSNQQTEPYTHLVITRISWESRHQGTMSGIIPVLPVERSRKMPRRAIPRRPTGCLYASSLCVSRTVLNVSIKSKPLAGGSTLASPSDLVMATLEGSEYGAVSLPTRLSYPAVARNSRVSSSVVKRIG